MSGGKGLGVAAVGLVLAAAALGGAGLTGVALLALAAIAALVATAGAARRVLGALLALVGGTVAGVAVVASGGPSAPPTPGLLAVTGGALVAVAGVFVLLRAPHLARLGARYAPADPARVDVDPDRAAWAALDAGRDPTADPPGAAPDRLGAPGAGLATPPAVDPADPDGGRLGGAV